MDYFCDDTSATSSLEDKTNQLSLESPTDFMDVSISTISDFSEQTTTCTPPCSPVTKVYHADYNDNKFDEWRKKFINYCSRVCLFRHLIKEKIELHNVGGDLRFSRDELLDALALCNQLWIRLDDLTPEHYQNWTWNEINLLQLKHMVDVLKLRVENYL